MYNVSHHTLTNCYHSTLSQRKSQPNSQKLTSTKEEILLQHILDLNTQGFSPQVSIIQEIANLILANRDASHPQTVGKN